LALPGCHSHNSAGKVQCCFAADDFDLSVALFLTGHRIIRFDWILVMRVLLFASRIKMQDYSWQVCHVKTKQRP
jgi:hypothetical protein